jgi:hypothetical protein
MGKAHSQENLAFWIALGNEQYNRLFSLLTRRGQPLTQAVSATKDERYSHRSKSTRSYVYFTAKR